MILVTAGSATEKAFDSTVVFAGQLAARGYRVVIDEDTLPDEASRALLYESAPLLGNPADFDFRHLVMIGAEDLAEETLIACRRYALSDGCNVVAIGRFASDQARIQAQSKLSYAIGREPLLVDLNELGAHNLVHRSISPLLAAPVVRTARGPKPEVYLYLPADWLEDPMTLPTLGAMDQLAGFNLNLVISGKGKDQILKSKYASMAVYGYTEVNPDTLAARADIAVFLGEAVPGERMAVLALDLLRSGGVVIDATEKAAFIAAGMPALRGPEVLTSLPTYLQESVLPSLQEIARQASSDPWLAANSIERLESILGLQHSERASADADSGERNILFVPTNGVGLGHAQRCSQIARALPNPDQIRFAAFPSCVGLVESRGFPCAPLVQKSGEHAQPFANDILNYLRLKSLTRLGDVLVFDGGYVFDSIFRCIVERGLKAVWVRRGLWRAGQVSAAALDREKAFQRVIVPGEAFDELNAAYSFGDHVRHVGPIVQTGDSSKVQPGKLREKLKQLMGRDFDKLVVTMLGGGVAADRSAQIQAASAIFEGFDNVLHLVVVWPNARVASEFHSWSNTRVVRTRNALALAMAADFVISAVGYNSFHELLYHAVPAILIPQMAAYLDDQERRARAASDRGLAETVMAHELLQLERSIYRFLKEGGAEEIRENLRSAELPEFGNRRAAELIAEVSQ